MAKSEDWLAAAAMLLGGGLTGFNQGRQQAAENEFREEQMRMQGKQAEDRATFASERNRLMAEGLSSREEQAGLDRASREQIAMARGGGGRGGATANDLSYHSRSLARAAGYEGEGLASDPEVSQQIYDRYKRHLWELTLKGQSEDDLLGLSEEDYGKIGPRLRDSLLLKVTEDLRNNIGHGGIQTMPSKERDQLINSMEDVAEYYVDQMLGRLGQDRQLYSEQRTAEAEQFKQTQAMRGQLQMNMPGMAEESDNPFKQRTGDPGTDALIGAYMGGLTPPGGLGAGEGIPMRPGLGAPSEPQQPPLPPPPEMIQQMGNQPMGQGLLPGNRSLTPLPPDITSEGLMPMNQARGIPDFGINPLQNSVLEQLLRAQGY